jgi:hypothetical protein
MSKPEKSSTGCRKTLALAIVFAALLVSAPFAFYLLIDQQNAPLCHKAVFLDVEQWHNSAKDLPNVKGSSAESLNKLFTEEDPAEWNAKYQYLPGLRLGDPGDLVLMYMKRPTRYIWHGKPQTIFRDPMWMTVSLDFAGLRGSPFVQIVRRPMPYQGENSERLSLEDFKSRLRKTLDFLRENNRPNWQTVVAENEDFLKTLERK